MAEKPVRVLVVDDSSLVRRALQKGLGSKPGIEVVDVAPDPYVARDKIEKLRPDVLTLDIEMPRLDGISFLRKLNKFHPIPTIIVSSLAKDGSETALDCLEAGAFSVVCKPGESYTIGDLVDELADLVKAAAGSTKRSQMARVKPVERPEVSRTSLSETTRKIIAIGCSTGGTGALMHVLPALPKDIPGIVIVQHMPGGFTTSFAQRLNESSEIEVREAKDGDAIMPGLALLAPGEKHMKVSRDGARYIVRVTDGPRVLRHRPSVEVLFESAAASAGRNAMGVIMTGMGNDGAGGLKSMRDAGAFTLAEAESSCVVFGMPKAAIEKGGACEISPLDKIPEMLLAFSAGKLKGGKSAA